MNRKLNALIASYIEPHFVEMIRSEVPEVNVVYRPDLLGQPRYIADHSSRPDRDQGQEDEWRSLLSQADILFDFDFGNLEVSARSCR